MDKAQLQPTPGWTVRVLGCVREPRASNHAHRRTRVARRLVVGANGDRQGQRENLIGLNGTVNLPTCDLQAAKLSKVGAKAVGRRAAAIFSYF